MFTMNNVLTMPQSLGGIVTTTYDKHLTMVIPALIAGWKKFGYEENIHFFVRKFAPPGFFQSQPYIEPKKAEHYIPWYNGSGILLFSLDRPALAVGASIDYLYGDEARLFKRDKIKDVLLTIRGNAEHFGDLSQHGSVLFTTDLPRDSHGNWLFEYIEQMDKEVIEMILALQVQVMGIQSKYDTLTKKQQSKADREINKINDYINELRKERVYVSFASSIDNIHALGLDTIKRFKRMLTDLEWKVSVLSKRIKAIEKGFYGLFDDERHYYDAGNFEYMDNLHPEYRDRVVKDSRWDADVNPFEPLDIACDYNYAISSMVIGQEKTDMFQTQNLLWADEKEQLKGLCKKMAAYYRHHQCKVVNFYYDHTALQGRNAINDVTFADEVANCLEEEGWQVNRIYFGQALTHKSRYYMFAKMLKGDDPDLPGLGFNRANTEPLVDVMVGTGVVQKANKFEKDKRSEKDKNLEPIQQTHITEAWDMLVSGKYCDRMRHSHGFVDTM